MRCEPDYLLRGWSLGGNGSAAKVVAIGEATGENNRINFFDVGVCMPKRHRGATSEPYGSLRIAVIEGAGVGDNADLHRLRLGDLDDIFDDVVGEKT